VRLRMRSRRAAAPIDSNAPSGLAAQALSADASGNPTAVARGSDIGMSRDSMSRSSLAAQFGNSLVFTTFGGGFAGLTPERIVGVATDGRAAQACMTHYSEPTLPCLLRPRDRLAVPGSFPDYAVTSPVRSELGFADVERHGSIVVLNTKSGRRVHAVTARSASSETASDCPYVQPVRFDGHGTGAATIRRAISGTQRARRSSVSKLRLTEHPAAIEGRAA
jgi:hypothetical protein